METTNTLSMSFTCTNNKKSTISIDGIKADLSDEQVIALMDTIIEKNAFETKNGYLVSKASAQIVQKNVNKIILE